MIDLKQIFIYVGTLPGNTKGFLWWIVETGKVSGYKFHR